MTGEQLVEEARAARLNAYVPYSAFPVGAALEARDGTIYHGCNVENASYGLTNCAERTAFFRAIADGRKPGDFVALAVIGDTKEAIAPCGACRQVMLELGGAELTVILANLRDERVVTNPEALLPGAFSSAHLSETLR